jgi:hypothetical protein
MDPLDNPLTTRPIQMGCRLSSNRIRIDGSGLLTIRNAKLAMVRFQPEPGSRKTVPNCFEHWKWVSANLHIQLRRNRTANSGRFQWFPTVPQFAASQSNDVCMFTGMNTGERQPKSHDCKICHRHSITERTSGNVCLKKSLGFYMKQRLNFKSCCMVSMTIPNIETVKT